MTTPTCDALGSETVQLDFLLDSFTKVWAKEQTLTDWKLEVKCWIKPPEVTLCSYSGRGSIPENRYWLLFSVIFTSCHTAVVLVQKQVYTGRALTGNGFTSISQFLTLRICGWTADSCRRPSKQRRCTYPHQMFSNKMRSHGMKSRKSLATPLECLRV